MLALLALALSGPSEIRLPRTAICPDAAVQGSAVDIVYGDGTNGWFVRTGAEKRVRLNTQDSTVQAAGERGPKVAEAEGAICAAWQGDYRQGPKVWFARSIDGGKTFEAQRNLIDGETNGLDHVAVTARGKEVIVLWLDARGGQDANAPATNTIWYSLSTDSGKTFGPNTEIKRIRACACCSFSAKFTAEDRLEILYRSGIQNVRDIWLAVGSPTARAWQTIPVSKTGWVFAGCPMDGPRMDGSARAYTIDGTCFAVLRDPSKPVTLGKGKYPNIVASGLASWQDGGTLNWRNLETGETGMIPISGNRTALINGPEGKPLIIH